jgi:hypothetical protein
MTHIVGGIIAVILGIMGIFGWWDNFSDFLRGSIPLALLTIGLIAINTGLQLNKGSKK